MPIERGNGQHADGGRAGTGGDGFGRLKLVRVGIGQEDPDRAGVAVGQGDARPARAVEVGGDDVAGRRAGVVIADGMDHSPAKVPVGRERNDVEIAAVITAVADRDGDLEPAAGAVEVTCDDPDRRVVGLAHREGLGDIREAGRGGAGEEVEAHEGKKAEFLDICVRGFDDQVRMAVSVIVDGGDADGQLARRERQGGGRGHRPARAGEHHVGQAVVRVEGQVVLPIAVEIADGDRVGNASRRDAVVGRGDDRAGEGPVAVVDIHGDGVAARAARVCGGQEYGEVESPVGVAREVAHGQGLGLLAGGQTVGTAR